jgi:hypothetical protein
MMLCESGVADILERKTKTTIASWLSNVNAETDIITVPLSAEDRCVHLPEMFLDIVTRLRNPLPLGTRALMSDAAHDHGSLRREQGYTAAMMVEESRMLQVSIFMTLQLNRNELDSRRVLEDVMVIADEVDSQLAQAISSYIFTPTALLRDTSTSRRASTV